LSAQTVAKTLHRQCCCFWWQTRAGFAAGLLVARRAHQRRRVSRSIWTSHWWQNLGDKIVTLLLFEILHDKVDHNM